MPIVAAGAGRDPQLEQLLESLEPELLEPVGLAPGELFAGQVAESRPRPLCEGSLSPASGGVGRTGRERLAGLPETALEAGGIELVVGHRQPIAGRRRAESISGGAESVADPRDVYLDRLDRSERLVVGPQPVGEELVAIGRSRWSRSSARTLRWRVPPSSSGRPSASTAMSPRRRNSSFTSAPERWLSVAKCLSRA